MNWAELFLIVIGAVVGLMLALVACVSCIVWLKEWYDVTDAPSYAAGFDAGREDLRYSIIRDSWWFSESPETTAMLQELAKGGNVSTVRDKWREARKSVTTGKE